MGPTFPVYREITLSTFMFLIDDLGRDQLSTLEPSRLYGETQYGLLERAVLGSQIGV